MGARGWAVTATKVNGLEVIADEPTEAEMIGKNGRPIIWHQTRTLLLEDGSTVYGCVHCDYTSDNPRSIRPHLNAHNGRKAIASKSPDLGVSALIQQLQELQTVAADRDAWRERAQRAEQTLTVIRKALKEK